ncbi:Pycsar system effector family protein [Actinoplanes sp. NPDC049265]|uniref:Pycsar system effector family protein n=1 Tax=Actinoplanes sp. NPDC049265 TaxID=3363902 RepID=UPI00371DF007
MTSKPDTNPTGVVADALTDVQNQLARVDTKASMLLAGALSVLAAGAAILAKAHLPVAVVVTAIFALALIGGATALLITAVRPALGGNHGFMRWANAQTFADLNADLRLADKDGANYNAYRLWSLSRSVRRKYQIVRLAVDLLRAALALAAVAALLTAL